MRGEYAIVMNLNLRGAGLKPINAGKKTRAADAALVVSLFRKVTLVMVCRAPFLAFCRALV